MLGFFFIQQTASVNWLKIITTVLTNSGKELNEINSLSDAIIHGRSGCGKAVPAGEGVFTEIRSDKNYQKAMMGETSTAAEMIKEKVNQKIAKGKTSGTITYTDDFKPKLCFQCNTLGNFCGKLVFNATFTYDEEKKEYKVDAIASYSGVDPWDFLPKEGVSESDNFWNEKLPEKLVKLLGNYKEFDITYNIIEKYSFTIKA